MIINIIKIIKNIANNDWVYERFKSKKEKNGFCFFMKKFRAGTKIPTLINSRKEFIVIKIIRNVNFFLKPVKKKFS